MEIRKSERAPWGDFPELIRNGDLGELSMQPEYDAAKGGDKSAALALAQRLIKPETIEKLKSIVGDKRPRLVPVGAIEETGRNKIPLAFASVLAQELDLDLETDIIQSERVFRTGSGADHRLAFNPIFEGRVDPGQEYIVIDDTLSMGGTLASLRGYLENRGGKVLCAFAAVAHSGAVVMPVKQAMLAGIEQKHGSAMNDLWMKEFGYGIEQLTQGEAGHLKKAASVDAMRERLIAARASRGRGLDDEPTQEVEKASAGINVGDVIAKASHSPLPTAAFPSATDLNQEKSKLRDVDPKP